MHWDLIIHGRNHLTKTYFSGNVWLGFVDDAGKWSDHNGQDLTYTSWDDGKPNFVNENN